MGGRVRQRWTPCWVRTDLVGGRGRRPRLRPIRREAPRHLSWPAGPQRARCALGATVGVVSVAGVAGIFFGLLPLLHLTEAQPLGRLLATPLWWRLISSVRAAVAEELLFRGYALERLADLTGSLHIAAVISCLVFTVEHVGPWGWGHLLIAGFGGLTLTLLYVATCGPTLSLTSSWMPPSRGCRRPGRVSANSDWGGWAYFSMFFLPPAYRRLRRRRFATSEATWAR